MPFHPKASAPLALLLALPVLASTCSAPSAAKPSSTKPRPLPGGTIESRIQAQMAVLAGDALQGRGSGTLFELRAGQYIASQLQRLGVRPMGDTDAKGKRTFIQSVDLGRFSLASPLNPTARAPRRTWNVLGALPGSDPQGSKEIVLLSAHMDHLGVRPDAPGSDKIFNGADDDASGCLAVLELARALAQGPRSRRTVYFAFFGSEELGGLGAQHFVANLFVLARQGVIAHTVSSFGLHEDYHQPSDEADAIDFKHMARAIASMQKPVRWLADSTFRPAWNEGLKP